MHYSKLCLLSLCVGLILCDFNSQSTLQSDNLKQEDQEILSRQKRFPVIGYLSMMLGLLNTGMLMVSNVMINNMGNNPNNNFKKRSIDSDEETEFELSKDSSKVLSRQKRTFPVFGFLSFLMLLLNSVMLIQQNINNNNNNNNNNNVSISKKTQFVLLTKYQLLFNFFRTTTIITTTTITSMKT